jgi:hypothetical protein
MDREVMLRRALWAAAFFNVGGAILFAFPAAFPGRLAGLPSDVPLIYRVFVAMFVLLFAGAYAYLGSARPLNRAFVAFGAIGKASAFLVALGLWLAGAVATRSVLIISGDAVLAALFAWGLMGTRGERA